MGTEDTCVSQAQLDELAAKCEGQFKLVDAGLRSLKELLGERDKFLNELIERNAAEAGSNHRQIHNVIELAKTELRNLIEAHHKEFANFRGKTEEEIRTLREGRSTDKGFKSGMQPFLAVGLAIITALLVTALTNFFFNAGRATEVNKQDTSVTAPHK